MTVRPALCNPLTEPRPDDPAGGKPRYVMPNAAPHKTHRAGRAVVAALACLATLCAAPRPTLCDSAPPTALLTGDESLRNLVGSLRLDDQISETPDGHALRLAVEPYAVRLGVDKSAVHPLSGPVAVRQDSGLGAPGLALRLVSLAPLAPPVSEPAPQPTSPANGPRPDRPTREVAVKNTTPAEPAKSAPPAPAATLAAAAPGHSLLVAGDSLSIYLADALRPLLAGRPGTSFHAKGKISSGLARPDFFDWERAMTEAATASRPDVVCIMIATNDNQTLTRPDGKKVAFGRPGWETEYARRVRKLVELARLGNPKARIYWVGAPVMADARLNADVTAINAVIAKEIAALPGCRFVDVRRTLADADGRYAKNLPAPGGPRTIRTPDGVHLTAYGAKLLAHAALASMSPTVATLEKP